MDIISATIKYLQDFAATSEATYHVNPWIFLILFFGSALPLYYGYYRIGKSVVKYEKRENKKQAFDKKELKTGVTISVFAWFIPYIYVVLFGKLPLYIWLIFIAVILITGFLFFRTLKSKIRRAIKG